MYVCVCVFLCKAGQMPKHARVMFLNVDHEDVLIYDVSQEDGSRWWCVGGSVCVLSVYVSMFVCVYVGELAVRALMYVLV